MDLGELVAVVMGKARRPRACPLGMETSAALDRYPRVRARDPKVAESDWKLPAVEHWTAFVLRIRTPA